MKPATLFIPFHALQSRLWTIASEYIHLSGSFSSGITEVRVQNLLEMALLAEMMSSRRIKLGFLLHL